MAVSDDMMRVLGSISSKMDRKGIARWNPSDAAAGFSLTERPISEAEVRAHRDDLLAQGYIEPIGDDVPLSDGVRVIRPIEGKLKDVYKTVRDNREGDNRAADNRSPVDNRPPGRAGATTPTTARASHKSALSDYESEASGDEPLRLRSSVPALSSGAQGRRIIRRKRQVTELSPAQQRYAEVTQLTNLFVERVRAELGGRTAKPTNLAAMRKHLRETLGMGITVEELTEMIETYIIEAKGQGFVREPWKQFVVRRDSLLEVVRERGSFASPEPSAKPSQPWTNKIVRDR